SQPEQTEHGTGYPPRFLSLLPSKQLGVHRNEGGGEDSLTEKILQEVRDLEGGIGGISRIRGAEIVGEDAVPNQPEEAAQQDARGNGGRGSGAPPRPGGQGLCGGGRVTRWVGSSSKRCRNTFSS